MKKINKPLFFTCLVFVLLFVASAVYCFTAQTTCLGVYTFVNYVGEDKISTTEHCFFGPNNRLQISTTNTINTGEETEAITETLLRCDYKVENGNVYIDLSSSQIFDDTTDTWSEISNTAPNWLLISKNSSHNAFYMKATFGTETDIYVNYVLIGVMAVATVMAVIFFIKMLSALKPRTVAPATTNFSDVPPLVRYDQVTGQPYAVKPTGYDPISGLPRYDGVAPRKRATYGWLAILFGSVGIQYFYAGKLGKGITCVLFSWSGVPGIIGFMTGIFALCTPKDEFQRKYIDRR